MDRDASLLAFRPALETAPTVSPVEAFLHETLRPVLKLQNDVLLALVADDVRKRVPGFSAFAPDDQRQRLAVLLKTDSRLKRMLLGVVFGVLTSDELAFALSHDAEVRRRIMTLLAERVGSQAAHIASHVLALEAAVEP